MSKIKDIVEEVYKEFSFRERQWVKDDIRFREDVIKGALARAVRLGMDSQ